MAMTSAEIETAIAEGKAAVDSNDWSTIKAGIASSTKGADVRKHIYAEAHAASMVVEEATEAMADYPQLKADIYNVGEHCGYNVVTLSQSNWEQGALNSNGVVVSTDYNIRIRSNDYIPTPIGSTVKIVPTQYGDGTYYKYFFYNSEYGTTYGSDWITESAEFVATYPYIKLVARQGQQTITPEFSEYLKITITNTEDVVFSVNGIKPTDGNVELVSKWNGKKWVSYGDSVTQQGMWQDYVSDELGLIHTNCGVGGIFVAEKSAGTEYSIVWEQGALDSSGAETASDYNIRIRSNYVNIATNTDISLTCTNPSDTDLTLYAICYYDENKTFVSRTSWSSDNITINTANNYIRIVCRHNNDSVSPEWGSSHIYLSQKTTHINWFGRDLYLSAIPTDTDVITIMGGTNDFGTPPSALGEAIYDKTTDTFNTDTFQGGLAETCRKIYSIVPTAKIVLMSLTGGQYTDDNYDMPQRKNALGYTGYDYAKATEEVANLLNLPYINVWNDGINVFNRSLYISDTVHPNAEGGKLLASIIIGGLKNLEPVE